LLQINVQSNFHQSSFYYVLEYLDTAHIKVKSFGIHSSILIFADVTNNQSLLISSNVNWVGVNDSETPLFEALWRIPEGVSYNSYLIVGTEKTALIDYVNEKNALEHFDKISKLTGLSKLDYLIINHLEPDHTGALPELLKKAPNAIITHN
jgi:flavorubredoxin